LTAVDRASGTSRGHGRANGLPAGFSRPVKTISRLGSPEKTEWQQKTTALGRVLKMPPASWVWQWVVGQVAARLDLTALRSL